MSAQNRAATITGTITDPDGHGVASAPVQAKNTKTRALHKTTSSASGSYVFGGLPPGTYELSVPAIGVTLANYERKRVVLRSGRTLRLDVRLQWGVNLGTPGDDAAVFLASARRESPPPSGPAPHTPEGEPDLSGVWIGSDDPNPEEPPLLPWASAVMKRRKQLDKITDNPSAHCLPASLPLSGAGIYKFVQTPALLVMMFEDVIGYRQVFLDGRGHPKDGDPSWMGHSIARWENDTLVVDTIGFNERSWLGLYPHTEKLHIVERYQRRDLGHLDVQITAEDPGTFLKPWTIRNVWELAPKEDVLEYVCNENNKDLPHLSGK